MTAAVKKAVPGRMTAYRAARRTQAAKKWSPEPTLTGRWGVPGEPALTGASGRLWLTEGIGLRVDLQPIPDSAVAADRGTASLASL